jgi:hypothetical protein
MDLPGYEPYRSSIYGDPLDVASLRSRKLYPNKDTVSSSPGSESTGES